MKSHKSYWKVWLDKSRPQLAEKYRYVPHSFVITLIATIRGNWRGRHKLYFSHTYSLMTVIQQSINRPILLTEKKVK